MARRLLPPPPPILLLLLLGLLTGLQGAALLGPTLPRPLLLAALLLLCTAGAVPTAVRTAAAAAAAAGLNLGSISSLAVPLLFQHTVGRPTTGHRPRCQLLLPPWPYRRY